MNTIQDYQCHRNEKLIDPLNLKFNNEKKKKSETASYHQ